MEESEDACDLDTLSALLEPLSEEEEEACAPGPTDKQTGSSAGYSEGCPVVNKDLGQRSAVVSELDGGADEEMEMEALSSMLDQDSDLEDTSSQLEQGFDQREVTADDIAAFFDESSDNEADAEKEELEQETNAPEMSSSSPDCCAETNTADTKSTAQDPQHVKQLQDELSMMQQRMMEIQRMLASQSCSAVTPPPPTTPTPSTSDATQGSSQMVSSSPSPLVSSSSSNKTFDNGSRKVQPSSLSSAKARAKHKEKKHPTGHSKSLAHSGASSGHGSIHSGTSASTKTSVSNSSSSDGVTRRNSAASRKTTSASVSSSSQSIVKAPASSSTTCSSSDNAVKWTTSSTVKTTASSSRSTTPKSASLASQRSSSNPQLHSASRNGDRNGNSLTKCGKNGKKYSDKNPKEDAPTAKMRDESKGGCLENGGGGLKKKEKSSPTFLAGVAEGEGGKDSGQSRALKRRLFGDDSDSDWEDMEGDKAELSSSGQEMRRLLHQRQGQPQHYASAYNAAPSTAKAWKSKAAPSSATEGPSLSLKPATSSRPPVSGSSGSAVVKKEADTKDCMTEKFSGLRIINPKVSSIMLASKMDGRRMIAVSSLHLKVKGPEVQGDWVTIGVIVQKSESRKSQTGKTYSIWKLSDLHDTDRVVSFFLFGQVYKQLWKMDVGTVIGLLNPNIMDNMEKSPGDVAFTINNCQQAMEIGRSRDLGWCVAKTKRGAACTNFVNRKMGDFCTYHVQAAYRKQSAKRSELHGSCPGTAPKSSLKSKVLQNNTFFYGGECFTASKEKGGGVRKDKVTLTKLQAVMTQQEQHKVTTLAVQNLLPAHSDRVKAAVTAQHDHTFLDMLSVPTAGSMNLVRHIANAEVNDKDSKGVSSAGVKAATFQSIHARDLLKQHRRDMASRMDDRRRQLKSSPQTTQPRSSSHSPGPAQAKQSPRPASSKTPAGSLSKSAGQALSKSSRLSEPSSSSASLSSDKGSVVDSSGQGSAENNSRQPRAADPPMLGKGFYPGGKIDLFAESPGSGLKPTATELAKRKAIQKVQAIGGLDRVDPNDVRTPTPTPTATDKVRKRVLENIENDHKKSQEASSSDAQGQGQSAGEQPARKRSRLLGNVDPNCEEVKRLLSARSSHTGALAQAEADREGRYFDNLEKKEMMEDKMKTITSMEVTVFTCQQCKYTAVSQGDRCKQENHSVRRHKGKRRFFACKKCKHRTTSLHRYPTSPCKKCGEQSYEKTSMYKEKTGPKLENETLCLRGDESKFTNAMDQKVYLNTMVQD